MRIILTLIMLAPLVACVSQRERYIADQCEATFNIRDVANGRWQSCADREGANYQCRSYGFYEGTPDFSKCLMTIDINKKIETKIDTEVKRQVDQQLFINGYK